MNGNPMFIVKVRFGLWMAQLIKQGCIWFGKNGSEMNLTCVFNFVVTFAIMI